MTIQTRKYSVDYCAVLIPVELAEKIPVELKYAAVDAYAKLKDGIEVTADNLNELVNNTSEFAEMPQKWREFLREVIKIDSDSYIFHN